MSQSRKSVTYRGRGEYKMQGMGYGLMVKLMVLNFRDPEIKCRFSNCGLGDNTESLVYHQ